MIHLRILDSLFQMLKMNKNYEPVLSEWIIAMVKDVEELNITMHILGKLLFQLNKNHVIL